GRGCQSHVFRQASLTAAQYWQALGHTDTAVAELLTHLRMFKRGDTPWNMDYNKRLETPMAWWLTFDAKMSQLPDLALKLFSIVPSQAGCERNFSTLGWMLGDRRTRLTSKKIESMAKIRLFLM